jgi:monofunctional biosynthetic peptidoglycan transglycosylase
MPSASSADITLFDFQAATNTATWQVVNDDVMGGVSTSSFDSGKGFAVFQGTVSLENNGGFASARSIPVRHDFTGCDAFVIRVRGDGQRYKFSVRTDRGFDGVVYQAAFGTQAGEWQDIQLRFEDFVPTFRGRVLRDEPRLNPASITSVGFLISDKQAGRFRLDVGWIKALRLPAGAPKNR